MKKRFLYLAVLCLVCSVLLSACGMPKIPFLNKDNADIASDPVVAQSTINMMDLEGVYTEQLAHRGTLRLTAKDSQTASITIDWPGSATESAHWEMTGTYDPQKQAIVYNDAVMMEQTTSETGAQSNRLVSSSGTGRFTVSGKNLAWTDDLAYIGSDPSTFTYSMSLADDTAVLHDDTADHRVRAHMPFPAPRQLQRPSHIIFVSHCKTPFFSALS